MAALPNLTGHYVSLTYDRLLTLGTDGFGNDNIPGIVYNGFGITVSQFVIDGSGGGNNSGGIYIIDNANNPNHIWGMRPYKTLASEGGLSFVITPETDIENTTDGVVFLKNTGSAWFGWQVNNNFPSIPSDTSGYTLNVKDGIQIGQSSVSDGTIMVPSPQTLFIRSSKVQMVSIGNSSNNTQVGNNATGHLNALISAGPYGSTRYFSSGTAQPPTMSQTSEGFIYPVNYDRFILIVGQIDNNGGNDDISHGGMAGVCVCNFTVSSGLVISMTMQCLSAGNDGKSVGRTSCSFFLRAGESVNFQTGNGPFGGLPVWFSTSGGASGECYLDAFEQKMGL